ncbi:DUF2653 family protein [Aneurinibacillus sp. Ricciae_BoGa-3]|uniref:DUF2653 family protein n=1 Tax=Aneurinibacillus sp. Ricciae_BoGa-3 TaxID=3022697 RepID=UPI0023414831|nr:DUF2653 family protein [Aneurinibacillus sp. Ricciae_BoGa-3]WCK53390.1 DUF2653 family protein [Aneurinibacillus sp. Ricciae_BoGa-3]
MKIHFFEQDVVDACCVFASKRLNCTPEDVDVDLQFNPSSGFAADARRDQQNIRLTEQEIIDGVAVYLADYHQFVPERLKVNLIFNQQTGIEADILTD